MSVMSAAGTEQLKTPAGTLVFDGMRFSVKGL
jgi:hypothetical protein